MISSVKLTQLQLILAGLQAGSKIRYRLYSSYWYVRYKWMSFGIINLNKTMQLLRFFISLINSIIFSRGKILYVGSSIKNSNFYKPIRVTGEAYIANEWIGGLLTNFKRLWKVYNFTRIGRSFSSKLKNLLIYSTLRRLPSMVLLDPLLSSNIPLNESSKLKIPTISFVDVDNFSGYYLYAIPGNSTSIYSSFFLLNLFSTQIILAKIRLVLQFGKNKGIFMLYKNNQLRKNFSNVLRYYFFRKYKKYHFLNRYRYKGIYNASAANLYRRMFEKKFRYKFKRKFKRKFRRNFIFKKK